MKNKLLIVLLLINTLIIPIPALSQKASEAPFITIMADFEAIEKHLNIDNPETTLVERLDVIEMRLFNKKNTGSIIPRLLAAKEYISYIQSTRNNMERSNYNPDYGNNISYVQQGKKNHPPSIRKYFEIIERKIKYYWKPPAYKRDTTCTILFTVNKMGRIANYTIKKPSESTKIDNSALEALQEAAPFGYFPSDFNDSTIDIEIDFNHKYVPKKTTPLWPSTRSRRYRYNYRYRNRS